MPNPLGSAVQAVGEAVLAPVVKGAVDMGKIGVESITSQSSPTSPQTNSSQTPNTDLSATKADELKKRNWATSVVNHYAQIDAKVAAIRQAKEEKAKQQEQEDVGKVKQLEVIETKKKEDIALKRMQTSKENKNIGAG